MVTDTAINEIKDATGVEHVSRIQFDLAKIEREGLFGAVHQHGLSALDTQLSWKALGTAVPSGLAVKVRSPFVGLLPEQHRQALLAPSAKIYDSLRMYSIGLTSVEAVFNRSGYRWIPWTAWPKFKAIYDEQQGRLASAKQEILDNYDALRLETTQSFVALAEESYRRFKALGETAVDRDVFIAEVVSVLEARVPTRAFIEQNIRVTLEPAVMSLSFETQLAAQQWHTKLDAEAAKQAASHADIVAAQQKEQSVRLQTEEEVKVKRELEQLKLAAADKLLKEQLSPVQEGAMQLQGAIYKAASDLAKSLKDKGFLTAAASRKAKNLTQWFAAMNWTNDEELEALLVKLESLASTPSTELDTKADDLALVLADIRNSTYDAAHDIIVSKRGMALEL